MMNKTILVFTDRLLVADFGEWRTAIANTMTLEQLNFQLEFLKNKLKKFQTITRVSKQMEELSQIEIRDAEFYKDELYEKIRTTKNLIKRVGG